MCYRKDFCDWCFSAAVRNDCSETPMGVIMKHGRAYFTHSMIPFFQPVKSESALESDASMKVLTFQQTPIMSTYLLAFVVGEFDYVEGKDTDGILVRVYTPTGKKEQGQFALEVRQTLPFSIHKKIILV